MGYTAGPGYDRVTGLGSVDAGQLIEGWAADFSLSGPTTLTVNRGASSSGQVQVSATGDFTGTVALSCTVSSNLPDTTCQVPANVGTGAVQVTVANSSTSAVIVQRVPNKPVWTGAMMIVFVLTLCFWKRRPALKFAFILPLVLVVAGCGGGEASSSSGSSVQTTSTPPVSGSVTITGQAGALSHKISIPVTLQ